VRLAWQTFFNLKNLFKLKSFLFVLLLRGLISFANNGSDEIILPDLWKEMEAETKPGR
jgi:hypothetical protein